MIFSNKPKRYLMYKTNKLLSILSFLLINTSLLAQSQDSLNKYLRSKIIEVIKSSNALKRRIEALEMNQPQGDKKKDDIINAAKYYGVDDDSLKSGLRGFEFFSDQDVLAPKNQDRNYTMGLFLRLHGESVDKISFLAPRLHYAIDKLLGVEKLYQTKAAHYTKSLEIYCGGFTPLWIDSVSIVRGDRPFANIVGISHARTFATLDSEPIKQQYAISSRFSIGILGTDVARVAQSYIHENHWLGSTRPVPLGWHNQISNGGELTALYSVILYKPIVQIVSKERPKLKFAELTLRGETNAGYYVNGLLGINARIGYFKLPYWIGHSNATTFVSAAGENKEDKAPFIQGFLFFDFGKRAVLYNAMLEGQLLASSYTMQRNQLQRLINETAIGATLSIWKFNLSYAVVKRTREFNTPFARSHQWGNASLSFLWNPSPKPKR
jgi:lipid A 3-O-deacylase